MSRYSRYLGRAANSSIHLQLRFQRANFYSIWCTFRFVPNFTFFFEKIPRAQPIFRFFRALADFARAYTSYYYFAFVGCALELSFAFFLLVLSLVSSFRRHSREDFLPRKYYEFLFLSVEGSSSSFTRSARPSPSYFLFSLSTTTAHTRETALSVSARESTSRERENV